MVKRFVRLTLLGHPSDLSALSPPDNGPVFSALDDMMLRLSLEGAEDAKKSKGSGDAKKALKNLLRSGIPGIEGMFGGQDAQPKVGPLFFSIPFNHFKDHLS